MAINTSTGKECDDHHRERSGHSSTKNTSQQHENILDSFQNYSPIVLLSVLYDSATMDGLACLTPISPSTDKSSSTAGQ